MTHTSLKFARIAAVCATAFLSAGANAALIEMMNSTGGAADASFIDRSVTFTTGGTITDINLSVDWSKCGDRYISNTFMCNDRRADFAFPGEAWMTLFSPTGVSVALFPSQFFTGPSGAADVTMLFDDEATASLPRTIGEGTFRPVNALSAFDGLDLLGTWTLRIGDTTGFDPILFRAFTLSATIADPAAEPTSAVPEPGSLALLGLGLAGLGALRRKQRAA